MSGPTGLARSAARRLPRSIRRPIFRLLGRPFPEGDPPREDGTERRRGPRRDGLQPGLRRRPPGARGAPADHVSERPRPWLRDRRGRGRREAPDPRRARDRRRARPGDGRARRRTARPCRRGEPRGRRCDRPGAGRSAVRWGDRRRHPRASRRPVADPARSPGGPRPRRGHRREPPERRLLGHVVERDGPTALAVPATGHPRRDPPAVLRPAQRRAAVQPGGLPDRAPRPDLPPRRAAPSTQPACAALRAARSARPADVPIPHRGPARGRGRAATSTTPRATSPNWCRPAEPGPRRRRCTIRAPSLPRLSGSTCRKPRPNDLTYQADRQAVEPVRPR